MTDFSLQAGLAVLAFRVRSPLKQKHRSAQGCAYALSNPHEGKAVGLLQPIYNKNTLLCAGHFYYKWGATNPLEPLLHLVMYLWEIEQKRRRSGLPSLLAPEPPPITDTARLLEYKPKGKLWVYRARRAYIKRKPKEEPPYLLGLS